MSKCVVTGAAGFIGSHLTCRLLAQGHEVILIDNFSTGRMENLAEVQLGASARLLKLDISREGSLDGVFDGVRWVFHQAATPSVQRSIQDPVATNRTNVNGTLHVLEEARRAGVEKLVFAASSSAYGDTEVLPKHESMPARPKSPYALQKFCGETYCRMYAELYGLATVSLRYFNVFGPRQDPNSPYAAVIPSFIARILSDQSPVVYGDGEQTRDFTHIDNTIDANLRAAESSASGVVLNIACGERFSLNETVAMINSILGKSVQPVYQPARRGDVRHSLADITAAREQIGYEPRVSFRQGLERMVEWTQRQMGHEARSAIRVPTDLQ